MLHNRHDTSNTFTLGGKITRIIVSALSFVLVELANHDVFRVAILHER